MQTLTPKMGARVVAKASLARRSDYGIDDIGRSVRMKVWKRTECSPPIRGFYVGRRNKSNGSASFIGPEEGFAYKPVAYFEVWMVAYADNRDILLCLPKDVVLEEYYDKDNASS